MKAFFVHRASQVLSLLAVLLLAEAGCEPGSRSRGQPEGPDLGPTIGSVATVATPAPIPVEGLGLVGNLPGTGSATCPPEVRAYLKQYILSQLPEQRPNVDELINSNTTAVVRLEGAIPPLASKSDHFDLRVSLIPGSETTSLHGGWLYDAELRPRGPGGQATRPLATAAGPTYVDLLGSGEPDLTSAHVLGGGRVSNDYSGVIRLSEPDYTLADNIRDRLSERYGPSVATAMSPQVIEYTVPPAYARRHMRFVALVSATFMEQTPELMQQRIDTLVMNLVAGRNLDQSEVALEAIGRECLGRLAPLLDAADEQVRFRVARIMLDLRDDRALGALREIALDTQSTHRLEAMQAIAASARRNDASALMRLLLRDGDRHVVMAAYEHLRDMADPAVVQDFIGGSFYLERVVQANRKAVFVARRGDPRIVIFGAPLACRDSMFIESQDQRVVLDAQPGQGYVSLMRNNPMRPGVLGPLRTGFVLSEIIRALGTDYVPQEGGQPSGLGVSYAEIIALLEQMCQRGVVPAEFWPGPLPEFE